MLKAEIWYKYRTETVLKFYQYNLEIIALYKSEHYLTQFQKRTYAIFIQKKTQIQKSMNP